MNEKTNEAAVLKGLLEADEHVNIEIVEHRLGGARWLWPVHAYATNNRIIMIRRHLIRSHTIRILKYVHITEIVVEGGIFFSKIHLSLVGEQPDSKEHQKWMVGITSKDAAAFIKSINSVQEKPVSGAGIKVQ